MNAVEASQFADIIERVKDWPPESRIVLARRHSGDSRIRGRAARPPKAGSVQEWIGMGAGGSPPPDDETVRRWIDEHRAEKYG